MTRPDTDPERKARLAKAKARILRGMVAYLVVLIAIGLAVWGVTGSGTAGAFTTLGLFLLMPWVATALRVSYQKRKGLPARGYWNVRPPSGG